MKLKQDKEAVRDVKPVWGWLVGGVLVCTVVFAGIRLLSLTKEQDAGGGKQPSGDEFRQQTLAALSHKTDSLLALTRSRSPSAKELEALMPVQVSELKSCSLYTISHSGKDNFELLGYHIPNGIIGFYPERHQIREDILIPPGFLIIMLPGTVLDFLEGSMLISQSPIYAVSEAIVWDSTPNLRLYEEARIEFISSDRTGQGLVFLNTDGENRLEGVVCDHLGSPEIPGRSFTGAVTFYESKVRMNSVGIYHVQAEDALNLVRCEAQLENLWISEARSDGIDLDFGTCTLRNCYISKCGNDGIDLSGLDSCYIEKLSIRETGDKAVSIGEAANARLNKVKLSSGKTGIACKDRSSARVEGLQLDGFQVGLALYQKKEAYGPAELFVDADPPDGQLQLNADTLYSVGPGSLLNLNGKSIWGR